MYVNNLPTHPFLKKKKFIFKFDTRCAEFFFIPDEVFRIFIIALMLKKVVN